MLSGSAWRLGSESPRDTPSDESPGGALLHTALRATVAARGTHQLPDTLPPPPNSRAVPCRKLAAGADPARTLNALQLRDGYELAGRFLNPILERTVTHDARWDAGAHAWCTWTG